MTYKKLASALACGVCIVAMATPASAQTRTYNIPPGSLKSALDAYGRQSDRPVIYKSDDIRGARSAGAQGILTAEAALEAILSGSGYSVRIDSSGAIAIVPGEAAAGSAAAEDESADIVVTGSRIRGAPIASQVISQNQEQMRDAGQNTLADAIRAIPQNFSGGQNPGVGVGVPAANGVNISSASTLNLRGLGGDATLTLLNGHRLAYNVTRQAIDISAIPFVAVDRLEIVADGASAIYGSDAVAGVANVILKRDYDGLTTSARVGTSTDGGNFQQQYSAVAGKTWNTGGLIAAYEFGRDTAITSDQRSYTAVISPGQTLFPAIKRHNAILSGHQRIGESLTFSFDALYNQRWSETSDSTTASGIFTDGGSYSEYRSESFAFAPALTLELPKDWEIVLSGMYGGDTSRYAADSYFGPGDVALTRGCYCNKAKSVELAADGNLFKLPGGIAKIAVGGGFRSSEFHGYRTQGAAQNIRASQDSYYGYGEVTLPVISPDLGVPLVNRLNLSAAIRHERYRDIDSVTTPKIGIIYAPSPDFDIKGSWGKSFRAPTLYQQYNGQSVILQRASSFGAVGLPSTATILRLEGGNPSVKPERATTWSATLALHPRRFGGAHLELTYFNVNYRDRIVAPITLLPQSLSNPIYAQFVTRNPTAVDQAAIISGANTFGNAAGAAYVPANVVAVIDNRNVNASRQSIQGIDISAEYEFNLNPDNKMVLSLSGNYIDSNQRLSPAQSETQLAGSIFNPPHWRARAGATFQGHGLTLSSFVNYIGGVTDPRFSPIVSVGGMTTFDLVSRYKIKNDTGILQNTEISVSLLNALNDKPDIIRVNSLNSTPFDSTNYSAIGRVVNLTIIKSW